MSKINLQTSKYYLRSIENSDISMIFKGLSHPEVIKYYGISYTSLAETKTQMQWYKNLELSGSGKWFAICELSTDNFLGAVGLNNLIELHQKAEIGIWLLPEHWGKGIFQEVMPKVVAYGFKELNLHRIEAFVESDNKKCKDALAKTGFVYEGTMKDCEKKNGKFINLSVYAILNK
ncbi:GNAT family protein [Mesonia sp.]|uniref:GNAT family N-acetyltransferase n=1 Tax=Mesonia sp. TaxID=1960830 RepID=UPI00176760E8|nr:GNAT family protein [Mesonia sp.]HIB37095.1 N-acetyltransferase [Mesonia sp.]HIO26704.1 N-acetyltransferase [Flavobacteriaceae bacterium]